MYHIFFLQRQQRENDLICSLIVKFILVKRSNYIYIVYLYRSNNLMSYFIYYFLILLEQNIE